MVTKETNQLTAIDKKEKIIALTEKIKKLDYDIKIAEDEHKKKLAGLTGDRNKLKRELNRLK